MPKDTTESNISWISTTAVVEKCRRTFDTWFVNEATVDEAGMYQMAEFVVQFAYFANGKRQTGRYKTGSPKDMGETLELMYDPDHPKRNTLSERELKPWVKAVAWAVGIAITLLLIRLIPDAM